jgi:hypothetical protein
MRVPIFRFSRWMWVLGGCLLLAAAGVTVALWRMDRTDAEHRRFYETGARLNGYLADYADALKRAVESGDPSPVLAFYSDAYASPGRGRWRLVPDREVGGVQVLQAVADGEGDSTRDELTAELRDFLSGIALVDRVKCKIDLIERADPNGDVVLRVKQIVDGVDTDGALFEERRFVRWWLENRAPQGFDWAVARDELVEGVRVAGEARDFQRIAPEDLGIEYAHRRDPKLDPRDPDVHLAFEMIHHAFGGVSSVDYDGDGRPDLFFADGERSRLYRHAGDRDGRVTYEDVTEAAGLGEIGGAVTGLFGDLDNDGHRDLVVLRYQEPTLVFHNDGDGTFTERGAELGLDFVAPSTSGTLLDYDLDGDLDLYVGLYGDAFRAVPRIFFFARNGGRNRLYRNDVGNTGGGDGWRFVDVSDASGVADPGWSLAVAAGDYDGDGDPDLVVANDFGRKSLYRNEGAGVFSEVAKEAGVLDFGAGMAAAFGDFDDDGRLDLYTANVNSNQRWYGEEVTVVTYLHNVLRTRWALTDFAEYWALGRLLGSDWVELGKTVGEGNSLFHNRGDGTFEELDDSHTNRAGWGWGVAFFDADNDADLDLYAANGWISNDPHRDL